jgi:integrase
MGLYKLCDHKARQRDRCAHAWWGSFRGCRVSLSKWSNGAIHSKAEAAAVLDRLREAIRSGSFDAASASRQPKASPQTFRELASPYKERHVLAKRLAIGKMIDYRLKPLIDRFGDQEVARIRTSDIEDFIADLRAVTSRRHLPLSSASINRTIELLRHMLNWAIGRELLDRSPFRRGTETLIRPELEDNVRRRRISEDEEARLLAAAPPFLRSMIITALDTGMRRGEMLALLWADIDLDRGLIVLRGATTKSGRTRRVPLQRHGYKLF